MKRLAIRFMVLSSLALFAGGASGQELLTNGNLDDPGLHEMDAIANWTLSESPDEINAATFATFADHTSIPNPPEPEPPGVGLWYRAFEGTTFDNPREPVDAHLTQMVPGVPGAKYAMTGWALFEANYAGGFDTLPSGGTSNARWPADTPSPTGTEFALEFLDAGNAVLPGSVVMDLHDDLGQNNGDGWVQHMLMATAPAGTVNVQVRASLLDGVNSDVNPQSAFVDDFSLVIIPEPACMALVMIGAVALLGWSRRR